MDVKRQTWEQFQFAVKNKKLFLFGAGMASNLFWKYWKSPIQLEGIIDNDKNKQGFSVGELVAEAWEKKDQDICISDISILSNYNTEDIVVLITSSKYRDAIAEQLRQMKVYNYYFFDEIDMGKNNVDPAAQGSSCSMELQYKEDHARACCKWKVQKNKIIVYIGNYGGHGRYITNALTCMKTSLDIVWVVKDLSLESPSGVRKVYEPNWKKYLYELETAHIWIYDVTVPTYVVKRTEQIYIQTKHWAGITLKKFFLDDNSTIHTERERNAIRYNGSIMDYIFTSSEFDEKTCRSGFAFNGKCIRIGSPRSDALFHVDNKEKVYKENHIDMAVHSVLYAPTFRTDLSVNKKKLGIVLDCISVRKALERCFGGIWCIMLRTHPSLPKESMDIYDLSQVIDVSSYPDSQELVVAADIMISDYSSLMFEAAFVGKPVFLYAPDKDQYVNRERDLLIDYDTLPFPIAQSSEELVKEIERFDRTKYKNNVCTFLQKYNIHEDGHASQRAAKFIIDLLQEKENGV